MFDERVVVRGAGDLGSGVALRLWRAGFPVIVLEGARPVAVRRTVSFSEAVYDGRACVEEAVGRLVTRACEAGPVLSGGDIPVLVDPHMGSLTQIKPFAVVDAVMAKRNTGTHSTAAPFVAALGPGFRAGHDVNAVIETNRGPALGRVIWDGEAEPNTGEPGPVLGRTGIRVLRAPRSGLLRTAREIGDIVEEGEVLAWVEDAPVRAGFRSLLRGMARDGLEVESGMKIGDLDPRLDSQLTQRVSDKSLAVAGGVLEAVLMARQRSRP